MSELKKDFHNSIIKMIKGILEKRKEKIDGKDAIEHVFKALADPNILAFSSAVFVPIQGNLSNVQELDFFTRWERTSYNLDENFVQEFKEILFEAKKTDYADPIGYDLLSKKYKITNNMREYFLGKKELGDVYPKKITEFFTKYNIGKLSSIIHNFSEISETCFYDSYFNVIGLYRSDKDEDFTESETDYIYNVMPFLHLIASMENIILMALLDEEGIPILIEGSTEGSNVITNGQVPFINTQSFNEQNPLFLKFKEKIELNKYRNAYGFHVRNPDTNLIYKCFVVVIPDIRNKSGSVLAFAAFNKDDYENKDYKDIYKIS